MADFTVTLTGLDEVLKRLDEKKIRRAAEDGMAKGMLYVHSTVPPYPAPPAMSSYRRTGTLGRSITTETRAKGGDIEGVIGTNIDYAPYVISETEQARVHKGRWWTLHDVVRKAAAQVVEFIRAEVAKVW